MTHVDQKVLQALHNADPLQTVEPTKLRNTLSNIIETARLNISVRIFFHVPEGLLSFTSDNYVFFNS